MSTCHPNDSDSVSSGAEFLTIADFSRLGNRGIEQAALVSLQKADEFLIPPDHLTEKLSHVEPFYTAVITFADKLGNLQLTKSWQPAQDSTASAPHFDTIVEKWTRLNRETQTTSLLADICLTDLSTSFGWAIKIEAAQAVEGTRLKGALVNFAANVGIDAQAALRQATDKPFIKFNVYAPNYPLKSLEQRIVYPFRLKDFDYNVELTRFQRICYPESRRGASEHHQAQVTSIAVQNTPG